VTDPFDVLGIEPRFRLDLESVGARHRDLSRALHPDRYVGRPANERRLALSRAIEVNQAFGIVRDPVRRAQALLARHGVSVPEGSEPPAEPTFLMRMLELREELAALVATKDVSALERFIERAEADEAGAVEALAAGFAELERRAEPPPEITGELVRRLGELRYYRRLLGEARAARDEIE